MKEDKLSKGGYQRREDGEGEDNKDGMKNQRRRRKNHENRKTIG